MQDNQQGLGNGLDLVGGAAVAGEVRSKMCRSEWAARGKEKGVGGTWVACRPQRALSQRTGLETPRVRAQPSFQICSLLSHFPAPADPRPGGAHILSPTLRTPPSVLPLSAPLLRTGAQVSLHPNGRAGCGAVLGETSQPRTLHPGGHLAPAEGSGQGPAGIRGMGCPAPPARPQLRGSCPLPSRFQTFRPGAPPPPGAAVAVPPSPVPRSVLPRNGGEGTPGLSIGGPGPPTPSLGPVAAPGRADVGAQREARALRPRNQPRLGACPSPAEPGGAGAAGGRTRGRAAGSPEPNPEPESEPEPGGRS